MEMVIGFLMIIVASICLFTHQVTNDVPATLKNICLIVIAVLAYMVGGALIGF